MFKIVNNWWESLCNGCGICCYEKEFNGNIIFINMKKPCRYLDKCSNLCSVYDRRFRINPDCRKVNLFQALFNPYLPRTCGYVKKIRFWKRSKSVR